MVVRYLHDDVYSCLTGALSRCDHQSLPSNLGLVHWLKV